MTSRSREALPSDPDAGQPSRLLGRGYQGAAYLRDTAAGQMIVKTATGNRILRAARRAMLRREHGIYQRLQGIAGIPRCAGLERGEDLLLEYIEGQSLRDAVLLPPERERFFAALLELIQAIHRAGVAHGDLKRKDNILVGPDHLPYLIDFGTAVSSPEGAGFLRRFLFRQLRRMDLNAWVKLKYQRQRIEMDPVDLQFHRPTVAERGARVVRRVWRKVTARRWRKAGRSSG